MQYSLAKTLQKAFWIALGGAGGGGGAIAVLNSIEGWNPEWNETIVTAAAAIGAAAVRAGINWYKNRKGSSV